MLCYKLHTMTREQYNLHKQRLEEQLRAGIQLLESAYQAQVRALDLVWMLQSQETEIEIPQAAALPASQAPAVEPSPSSRPRPRRRTPGEVSHDLLAALPRLPELFTRRDVCAALGYEPDRQLLYRLLQELRQQGRISVESTGEGQRATVYRRPGASHPPADV